MMTEQEFNRIKSMILKVAKNSTFYQKKFEGIDLNNIQSEDDFLNLPFTEKANLRDAYPLALMAVPEEEVVRIHSSSGTTGTPVIIPYTKNDLSDWAKMFKRCYETAGVTKMDRMHITPGYGLWTAGIGFQAGSELLGAMAIPMGPGNTDKQIQIMIDLKSTVLCATSSYALLLAEEITKRGVKDKIHLKKGIIGSERWGKKMRQRIADELGVMLYDIYGLTEIYGPGIAMSCDEDCGMHYWDDYFYFEIINPYTGVPVPYGETGELVVTTLCKEGAPLIRYRTRDLTKFIPGECACGRKYPRIDMIIGRSDDMVKVKGTNIYPSQIDNLLPEIPHASSEYQIMIDHMYGKDMVTVFLETEKDADREAVARDLIHLVKSRIGITVIPKCVDIGELPRSEKKSTRIFDNRY